MGQLVVVHHDHVFPVDLLDHDLGKHVGGDFGRVDAAGLGVEGGDDGRGFLHVLDRDLERSGDVRELAAAQLVEMVSHDVGRERVRLVLAFELEQETLTEVARTDAGGMELLDHAQDVFEVLVVHARGHGQLLEGRGEVAIFIDIADHETAYLLVRVRQPGQPELGDQVFLERFQLRQGIEHELAPLGAFP